MIHYIITDEENYITTSGIVQSLDFVEVPDGHTIHHGISTTITDKKKQFINGEIVQTEKRLIDYYGLDRRYSYPSKGDQLDVIWKFLEEKFDGQLTPDVEDMLSKIKKVKQDNPKK